MANSITPITKMVAQLDLVYSLGLLTSILEGANSALVREGMDAKTIQVPKISTQGLADYDKSTGFVSGDASLTWESHTLAQDRGREFSIDNADNMETAGLGFGGLARDFLENRVIPETDAYRFATMSGFAGNSAEANLTSGTVEAAIDTAVEVMDNKNVPEENRILFASNEIYKLIKQSDNFSRELKQGENINKNFEFYDNMKVVKVPKTRFYNSITLLDGTTGGQEAGGYIKTATTGRDLNFLIVHPTAVVPFRKIDKVRTFSPDVNQDADAYKFQMRLYHDIFELANKVDGVYSHNKTS